MQLTLKHDVKADAVYVRLSTNLVARTQELDEQRIANYDQRGEMVGIEFLGVSQGVEIQNLPHREELERLFVEHHIPIYA